MLRWASLSTRHSMLRALGLERKLALGTWFVPAFRLLRWMRRLRGTPLDVFGYAHVRRQERRLVGWYRELIGTGLDRLRPETYARIVEAAQLPDRIRGYEQIKLDNVAAVDQRALELTDGIEEPAVLVDR